MSGDVIETVTLILAGGVRRQVEIAHRCGDMAITRAVDRRGWRITHVPTSHAAPLLFQTPSAAIAALEALDEIVDWPSFIATLARGERPNVIAEFIAICEFHGGVRSALGAPDYSELNRRLREEPDND